jgi:hypothetical protein
MGNDLKKKKTPRRGKKKQRQEPNKANGQTSRDVD